MSVAGLKCQICKSLYVRPVVLACKHTFCLICLLSEYRKTKTSNGLRENGCSPTAEYGDDASVSSEADSGVFLANGESRTRSRVPSGGTCKFKCPTCSFEWTADESSLKNLPENESLSDRVNTFLEWSGRPITLCQLCEDSNKIEATFFCDQCGVFYCTRCRENFHPSRGPLKTHSIVAAHKVYLRNQPIELEKCREHTNEGVNYFCMDCTVLICQLCLEQIHDKHDVQAIICANKLMRGEISQVLNSLSEKARQAKDLVSSYKQATDSVNEDSLRFEAKLAFEMDSVIEALQRRKEQLVADLEREKTQKVSLLKQEVQECTHFLKQTTGLIEYCLEALQEGHSNAFLHVSGPVIRRVYSTEMRWRRKLSSELAADEQQGFRYRMDCTKLRKQAEEISFCRVAVPPSPLLIHEECYSEGNSVWFAWRCHSSTYVAGFALELDESNEKFVEVYRGKERACRVEGLHFATTYRARVRAYNERGTGPYSEVISLTTSEVAWFTLDANSAHPDIILSNNRATVTTSSFDERVVLGTIGFSRGCHYWEVAVDRYDSVPDPAFGVSRLDALRDQMLGKDSNSWAVFIDRKRSWFMHNNVISQGNIGGIKVGSVIGVTLDLDSMRLIFYLDGCKLGIFDMNIKPKGVFFPAISLNRNVQVTIHTGLKPPTT